ALVVQGDRAVAAAQTLGQDAPGAVVADLDGLESERVLVDVDQVPVLHDRGGRGVHVPDVVARDQRRGHDRPEGEVAAHLGVRHAAPADHHHVGVVELPGGGVARQGHVDVDDVLDAHRVAVGLTGVPDVGDVLGRAPDVGDVAPVPLRAGLLVDAVGVDAVEDRPAGGRQGVPHLGEGADLVVDAAGGRAPVVLEVVDAPRGE